MRFTRKTAGLAGLTLVLALATGPSPRSRRWRRRRRSRTRRASAAVWATAWAVLVQSERAGRQAERRTPHRPGGPDHPRRQGRRPGAPHSAGRRRPGGVPQAGRGARNDRPGGRPRQRHARGVHPAVRRRASWPPCGAPAPSPRRSSRRPGVGDATSQGVALQRADKVQAARRRRQRASPSAPCPTPTTPPPRPSSATR